MADSWQTKAEIIAISMVYVTGAAAVPISRSIGVAAIISFSYYSKANLADLPEQVVAFLANAINPFHVIIALAMHCRRTILLRLQQCRKTFNQTVVHAPSVASIAARFRHLRDASRKSATPSQLFQISRFALTCGPD